MMEKEYPPPYPGEAPNYQGQPTNQGWTSPLPGQPPSYNPYYPQQQQPYPQQQQPGLPVQSQQPRPPYNATGMRRVGKESFNTTCSNCGTVMTTEVHQETSIIAWMACGIITLVGFVCGCCLIPFCMDSLKEYTHYCPQCKAMVGKHRPIQ